MTAVPTDARFTDRTAQPDAAFQQRLARIEATHAAPESFDPIAALRRVEAIAHQYEVYVAACEEEGIGQDDDYLRALATAAEDLRKALRPADVAGGGADDRSIWLRR